MLKFLVLVSILFSQLMYSQTRPRIIYGDDDRQDPHNSKLTPFVELAKSTAAMIPYSNLVPPKHKNDLVEIKGKTLERWGICKDERFSHQIVAGRCSGFLVAPDLLVTAGHCIRNASDCSNHAWVFDYKVNDDQQSEVKVPLTSVYKCKQIISRALDAYGRIMSGGDGFTSGKNDFALIMLDRNVEDRKPLRFRKEGKIEAGTEVVMIGHPTGLPTKIAGGARVRSVEQDYFVANTDSFGGNSGSAVFNARTGEVEGILVRGEQDYVYDRNAGCRRPNRIGNDDGEYGEHSTHITNVVDLLRKYLQIKRSR